MSPIVPADALGAEALGAEALGNADALGFAERRVVQLDHLVTHEEWERDWSLREERFEVVDGLPLMTPSEHADNVDAITRLLSRLRDVLGDEWSYQPGTSIRIAGEPLLTYRNPDLSLLRPDAPRSTPLDPSHVELVVEALSPSTRREDLGRKRRDYASVGIPNYLVIDRSVPPRSVSSRSVASGSVAPGSVSSGSVPSGSVSPRLMLLTGPVGGDYPEPGVDAVGEVVTLRIAGREVVVRAEDLIR